MSLVSLANSPPSQIDASVLDYFLIEAVNTLRESTRVATQRQKQLEEDMVKANALQSSTARDSVQNKDGAEDEVLRARLETLGTHVGANLVERCVSLSFNFAKDELSYARLVRDRPRFVDTLDSVKFVCKDVWTVVWDKQVDNLRTNHRVIFHHAHDRDQSDYMTGCLRTARQCIQTSHAYILPRWCGGRISQGSDSRFSIALCRPSNGHDKSIWLFTQDYLGEP